MKLKKNQTIVYQDIEALKATEEESSSDLNLFVENFDLILRHADHIKNTPSLFFSSFKCAFISVAFLGHHQAGIGHLLTLWENEILLGTCKLCKNTLFIFSAGGSPLSGRNSCQGICVACRKVQKTKWLSFKPIMLALTFLKSKKNKRKILRTRGQYFTWEHGLTGKPVPDKLLDKGVQPATFEELIKEIQKRECD